EAHDKVVVDRQRRLYQDGIVARQDYEAAQNTFSKDVEKLQADREKVLADRLKVRQDQSKAAGDHLHISSDQNQVRIAQEALSRESRIFNANIYSDQAVEQAKATYFAAMQQLRQARDTLTIHGAGATGAIGLVAIPAPITGTVVARNVNPGMNVDNTNQTAWQMFTISNLTSVYVDASVSDKDLPHIHVGLPIKVQTSMGSSYTGQVNYISPTIDPQTHMIKVRCTIPNNQNQLKDGMYVTVWIQLAAPQFTLLVPSSAIQSDPAKQSSFVFVPKASGGFEQCPVRTGHDLNGQTEILSGLSQGQKVVTAGSILLKNQNSDSGDD
ncbi:MAG: efflux RND transporter periplasmic adaptor subunit, partial [Abitibacteriaceae bacterium]|nr:efflux RND transporter periplasmic adaptor subunit [Abditibacteriaceae bacterium]